MTQTIVVDTNIVIRYFLQDHAKLSSEAKEFFVLAQKGKYNIYLDEIATAEIIWVLTNTYKVPKNAVIEKVSKLLYLPWILNPRKTLINKALNLYFNSALNYIDCWLFMLSRQEKMQLKTFDKNLEKTKNDRF
ncbi:hypothetical protein A2954_02365 [Candidatus Roizmanbacteria bacterium RIFCSPLOWO2_01_FULL_37_12]|uniref:PIN domain-containing protein n=1 Tax=Candidatus Roizmanbacteria bacterium RIFCSPLOWO2_01_FULL_37_12 TaxID=1802056 RepID=A0A1F7I8H8_9BACT|nr:MAG: hypothetical protein A3D76_05335 [Candidatus Roizmanbacteria bacterium RIFCSPHIGHO2_02_FULL_37_9b]OGK39612.1 MAG: hypothetical protein A2954_02365 [Candidatus Roizmanbacteria bacterium RIFCSPLOWO2_01_FULL_37_12]